MKRNPSNENVHKRAGRMSTELLDQPPPATEAEIRWGARRLNLAAEAILRRWGPAGRKRLVALLRTLAEVIEGEGTL